MTNETIKTLSRRPAPAPRPFSAAFLDNSLFVGSWETDTVYAIDPASWKTIEEYPAPGKPYGLVAFEGELRIVVAHGEEDDRYLYRFVPGTGFITESKTPCPDLTGSYLAADTTVLYLGQMTNRRILVLDRDLKVLREIPLPARCAGLATGPGGTLFMISGDEELEHLQFGSLNVNEATFQAIAPLPDEARSLVHDGAQWWTCLRDLDELASFD
jgi:sugar lactone lactonase YvrE